MRPFQVSKNRWVNLEHVTDWWVEDDGEVLLMMSNALVDEHTYSIEGEYAERFIKLMDLLAQGNFL